MTWPAPGLRARISSAGHFPPVIGVPGQRGALAEIAVDAPIGVADAPRRRVTTLTLAPGSVLCFFTDGLVERRDEPVDEGIARLCAAVVPAPPENVCISVPRQDCSNCSRILRDIASASLYEVERGGCCAR